MAQERITESYLGGKFQSVRFVYHGFSPQQMTQVANGLIVGAIKPRIQAGQTVYDAPAPPLTPAYLRQKVRKGLQGIRDWTLTGNLMRSMKVTNASENRAIISFADRDMNQRAFLQNKLVRQFGVSPHDEGTLAAEFAKLPNHTSAQVVR